MADIDQTVHMANEPDVRSAARTSRLPILRWWWVVVAAIIVAVATALSVLWLLGEVERARSPEVARAELEAIRTALNVSLGSAGLFALWLAVRRQQTTERQLVETSRIAAETHAHQKQVAEISDFDASERRVTDLYTKAVEQLGSDKAPVRLGGIHALERLADDHGKHRQVVVDILCSYLRMPFSPPLNELRQRIRSTSLKKLDDKVRTQLSELEVRVTAQQVLQRHLRKSSGTTSGREHWSGMDVDLKGATLVDFDFAGCDVNLAEFSYAHFVTRARFMDTTFRGEAWFYECKFSGVAHFKRATFSDRAIFTRTKFAFTCEMSETSFERGAYFLGAKFSGNTFFKDAQLNYAADFTAITLDTESSPVAQLKMDGATLASITEADRDSVAVAPPGWEFARDAQGVLHATRRARQEHATQDDL